MSIYGKDIGAIYWKNIEARDTTGTFYFEGVTWDYDGSNELGDSFQNLEDSIVPSPTYSNNWKILPGLIGARFISNSEKKLFYDVNLEYRYGINYLPSLSSALYLNYGEASAVWVRGYLGGFNLYGLGMGTQVALFDNSFLTLGTNNILGLVNSKNTAFSLYFQYSIAL